MISRAWLPTVICVSLLGLGSFLSTCTKVPQRERVATIPRESAKMESIMAMRSPGSCSGVEARWTWERRVS